MRSLKALVASSALLLSGAVFAGEWQLDRNEAGVQLYTMDSENSPLKQVKVVTSVKSSLSSLVSFLSDQSGFPKWMDNVATSEKLKDISDRESISYTVVDAPWPEKDRDAVLYSRWEQDPETFVVTKKVYSEPMYLKEKDSMIRSPHFEAEWILTPKGQGVVEVSYISDFNPGGEIEGWVLDLFTYEIPYNTMKNLRATSLSKHTGAHYAFIKEPVKSGVAMTQ